MQFTHSLSIRVADGCPESFRGSSFFADVRLGRSGQNSLWFGGDAEGLPLIVWSPAEGENCTTRFVTPEELHQSYPEFEAHSRYLKNVYGSVFKSPETGNYELTQALPELSTADSLPTSVRQSLAWSKQDAPTPGAYPFHP
jgi:hypothetical protein